jgi:hypothetical protein
MGSQSSEWSWDVDAESRVSSLRMSGVVTATDVFAAQDDLAAHERFNPAYAFILDLSLATELPLSHGDAQAIVLHSPIGVHAPRAIVATTIVSAAMAHAYRAVRAEITGLDVVHVCHSMHDARKWVAALCGLLLFL